jgi:hypothetical protein
MLSQVVLLGKRKQTYMKNLNSTNVECFQLNKRTKM